MNADWMSDARKVPDEVMNYIRRIAVRAVVEDKESPELIAKRLSQFYFRLPIHHYPYHMKLGYR